MNQGECFFNKAAVGIPSHPWVIISDPIQDPDDVVIVNLTDADKWDDHTCVLETSDHSGWLTKRSAVAYRLANVTSVSKLDEALEAGLMFNRSAMPTAALDKILAGAEASDELKNAPRLVLYRQGLIGV